MSIQERLDKLKPYIKGMRFVNSSTVVDVLLKENWNIPTSETIMYLYKLRYPSYANWIKSHRDLPLKLN